MDRYKTKPVEIEAMTFNELEKFYDNNFVNGDGRNYFNINGFQVDKLDDGFLIHTLEGNMLMTKNHMLIIGVMGEVYPCKLEAFRGKYERVD